MRVETPFVCAVCIALTVGCSHPPAAAPKPAGVVTVRTANVSLRSISRAVESVGTLYPFDETVVSAELDGKLDRVSVDLGDRVTAGQELAHIADEEQRYLLQQSEAQVRQAVERLGLKNESERLRDVKESAEVRRAQADLTDAEQRYQRTKTLVAQGIGAQADLDQSTARLKSMQAAYDQAVRDVRNLAQDLEHAKASLDLQRKKLRDTVVRAPYPAFVKDRQITPGSYVKVNTPLFTLVKLDPIRLRLEIPERMAPWVRTGQVADVTLEAFENRHFQGRISRISPTVDQTKRTFVVEALIPNASGELKPGSYARAKLPTEKRDQIRLIPTQSVMYVLGLNKAYVVKNDVIESRDVKLGDRFADNVEVLEGVQDGEVVATSNLQRLDNGVRVQIESKPAMNGSD